jgi:hypothetical protein
VTDERASNWFAAAVIVLIVALLGIAAWGLLEGSTEAAGDDGLAGQFEVYTACLNENGAIVPQVESRGDGGFAVVVPGALLDGDVGDLRAAWQACRDVEPAFFGLLFAGNGVEGLPDLGELCDNLDLGGGFADLEERLSEFCQDLGG